MLRKEPAVILATLAAIVQGVAIFVTDNPEVSVTWTIPLLTLVTGLLTRQNVFSEHTIRQAGYTPAQLQERADDPDVAAAPEEKG